MTNKALLLIFCLFGTAHLSLANDQWIQKCDFGSFGRHRGVAVGIGNRVYAGTGHLNGTGSDTWYPDWWEFDPATNSWAQQSDYPGNNGNGDQDIVAIALGDMVYAGMGQLSGNNFYQYNPQTNTWVQVSAPPSTHSFTNTFPFEIDGIGYFPTLYSTGFYKYEPTLDLWTLLNPLPQSTLYGIPTFAIADKGYIKYGAEFYEYDPLTDLWTAKATFPGLYPHRPRGISQYGYGFFIGGFQGSPSALPWEWAREVWRYDPATDSWFQLGDFPGTTRRWAVIAKIDEKVYYGLGTNGTNFHDFWEFNSALGSGEITTEDFKAFPTIVEDQITFSSDAHQNFEVKLLNTQGQCLGTHQTSTGKVVVDVSSYSPGMFFYQISTEGKVLASDRFVVQ